ncbi:hypothetical protein J1G44_12480 [Cellulomonas sp. zg-ZUI199]|uniref:Hemagglutinin n=1 Tax=Cellulomonas wangleii TaxID=2816956 RepID=A0ABX8D154_9CELL|nr:hypothetical protein [Cellulomonas wangleii]MBO0925293.1 hypothetical protein [Cellulomonas wangleii]QVI61208.1 hypothetical protein KG103_11945 [Cellulomonas wangleii]
MSRPVLRALLAVALGALVAVVGVGGVVVGPAAPAAAADLSRFDPGYIISDEVFWAAGSMSQADVQRFLDQKGADCVPAAGSTCLRSYTESTSSRAATARCAAYSGAAGESAAAIITKVAAACGINPQVLLVTLQKEQGLVTARAGRPPATYQKAMGYGCPDTAACDTQYYGFFNQVYSAASQFRNYAANPTRYAHRAGLVNNVRYHPNAACGTSPVLIRNQATAGLYNYTPYQPNAAALAAGYGTGDACSSYGNRNFYSYFVDWFGSPTGEAPFGFLDSVTVDGQDVTATGWALDPDTRDPVQVHMYVGPASQAFVADLPRPDVDAVFGKGERHGYSTTMRAQPGPQRVCVWAIDSDGISSNTQLGCRDVVVPSPLTGMFDDLSADAESLTARGWVFDPDATGTAVPLTVTVDGVATEARADVHRPDVDAVFGTGAHHGFSVRVPAAVGTHRVCVTAHKSAPGRDADLGCRTVTVTNNLPTGFLDSVTASASDVTVKGWAIDPDTSAPIDVHVYVGSAGHAVRADAPRPDLAGFGKGPDHGFSVTLPAAAGRQEVCVYAINATPGPNRSLGCRTVTVVNRDPVGFIDFVTPGPGSVTVRGWAIDPDTSASIPVHVYAGGTGAALTADRDRPDLVAPFGLGAAHGFVGSLAVPPGRHDVCLYAINSTPGNNPLLGCRTVTVLADSRPPVGFVDALTTAAGSVTATGWALDHDTVGPVTVHLTVDGAVTAVQADRERPDLAGFGVGTRHGYQVTAPATPGRHEVCVSVLDSHGGPPTSLTCRAVDTP